MNKKTLGDAVRTARRDLRMTQSELAARVGVKASHIAYIEGNRRNPSLSVLARLAGALGLNRREMFLMAHPDAKALIDEPRDPRTGRRRDVWRQFASNRGLHRRHRITRAELRVLKQISLLQNVASPDQLLFILNAIRLAGAPPD
jgi:transcriptional regulator with XRE-family HTH domain